MKSASVPPIHILGQPKEGALVIIVFMPALLLALTPVALPDVRVAWIFGWILSFVFSAWAFVLLFRRSRFEPEHQLIIRQVDPWGVLELKYPLSEFVSVKRSTVCVEGPFEIRVSLVRSDRRAPFAFATSRSFSSLEEANADPEMNALIDRLVTLTGLPLVEEPCA